MGEAPGEAELSTRERAVRDAELEELRFHWDTAYAIEWDEEHGWRARRLDDLGGWLAAPGPDELDKVIFADYSARPVPRGAAPGETP